MVSSETTVKGSFFKRNCKPDDLKTFNSVKKETAAQVFLCEF